MTDPNHGNSIITRLRLIVEKLFNEAPDSSCEPHPLQRIRDEAENLLPLANVDDIEVIMLREAGAIVNGRATCQGHNGLADAIEAFADEVAEDDAARLAARGMGGPPNPDKTGKTLRRVVAASTAAPWEQEATELMGLTIKRHNAGKHVQLLEGTIILAEWWPGKGTTMRGGKRGPLCATGEDLIAWLRSLD